MVTREGCLVLDRRRGRDPIEGLLQDGPPHAAPHDERVQPAPGLHVPVRLERVLAGLDDNSPPAVTVFFKGGDTASAGGGNGRGAIGQRPRDRPLSSARPTPPSHLFPCGPRLIFSWTTRSWLFCPTGSMDPQNAVIPKVSGPAGTEELSRGHTLDGEEPDSLYTAYPGPRPPLPHAIWDHGSPQEPPAPSTATHEGGESALMDPLEYPHKASAGRSDRPRFTGQMPSSPRRLGSASPTPPTPTHRLLELLHAGRPLLVADVTLLRQGASLPAVLLPLRIASVLCGRDRTKRGSSFTRPLSSKTGGDTPDETHSSKKPGTYGDSCKRNYPSCSGRPRCTVGLAHMTWRRHFVDIHRPTPVRKRVRHDPRGSSQLFSDETGSCRASTRCLFFTVRYRTESRADRLERALARNQNAGIRPR